MTFTTTPPPPHSSPTRRSSDLSHRYGADRQGGGHLLHLRPSGLRSHRRGRTGDRARQAPGGTGPGRGGAAGLTDPAGDRKSTRLNSSHVAISYAVFCLNKKKHI